MATFTINILANQVPIVNAGPDQTLTASDTLLLSAIASDPDGSIVSVLWTKETALGDPFITPYFTFTDPTSLTTTVTDLTVGIGSGEFYFRVTVTDSSGETASDVVTITINNTLPLLPKSIPGVIDENTTSATMTFTALDADGIESIEVLPVGAPGSTTEFPVGATPIITPMAATGLVEPYPPSVSFNPMVTNMIPIGIYKFTIKYKGIGQSAELSHNQIVKNYLTRDVNNVLQVTDCLATSSPSLAQGVQFFGNTIQNGTILYEGNNAYNTLFAGGGNTYRGVEPNYVPGTSFTTITITSFSFDVDNAGVVSNLINC